MIKALIFDFDGLIIDSETADMRAWREEFQLAGAPMSEAEFARLWDHWAWHRQTTMIAHLAARAGRPIDQPTVAAHRLARYTDLCADLPARPGIREWITTAADQGLTLAVATNDDTHRATSHLARLGLAPYFQAVVTLQPGLARKPAPDLYLRALSLLDLDPACTVAIEDSAHGAEAAHRAGLRSIVYPTSTLSARTDLTTADLIVTDPATTTLPTALYTLTHQPTQRTALDPQPWHDALQAATDLVNLALADLPGPPTTVQPLTDATEVIAAVLHQWALEEGPGGRPMPRNVLRGRLANPWVDLSGAQRGLGRLAGTLHQWRPDPSGYRYPFPHRPPGQAATAARTLVDAAILHELGGIRLNDKVLAPLPGTSVLVPADVVGLVDWQLRPGDAPQITVSVTTLPYRLLDATMSADDLILDLTPAPDDTGRVGRGTHLHAVRCLVADLRRTAYLLTTDTPTPAVLRQIADRLPLYEPYPDLQLNLTAILAVLLIDGDPGRRGHPMEDQEWILAAVRQASRRLQTTPMRDRAGASALLTRQADTIQARHL